MESGFAFTTLCCLAFLFFFRPTQALLVDPLSHDPVCYLEWLYRFLSEPTGRCTSLHFAPGVAVWWLPFGFMGKIWAALSGLPIITSIEMFVGAASFLFWISSYYLLVKIFEKSFGALPPVSWASLFTFALPSFYYTFIHPFYAHSAEVLAALVTVFLLLENRILPALVTASLLSLTRFNDFPIFLMIGGRLWDIRHSHNNRTLTLSFFSLFLLGSAWFFRVAFVTGYDGNMYLLYLFRDLTLVDLDRFFFSRWQTIFLHTAWIVLFGHGIFFLKRLSWMNRGALVWMFSGLLLSIGWNALGFGQRYILGSYAAGASVLIEIFPWMSVKARRVFSWTMFFNALLIAYLTLLADTRFLPIWGVVLHWKGWESIQHLWGSIFVLGLSPLGFLFSQLAPSFFTTLPFQPHRVQQAPLVHILLTGLLTLAVLFLAVFSLVRWRKGNKGW